MSNTVLPIGTVQYDPTTGVSSILTANGPIPIYTCSGSSPANNNMSSSTWTTLSQSPTYTGTSYSTQKTITTHFPSDILSIYSINGKKILTLSGDGNVEWEPGISKTDANDAFGNLLQLSAEQRSGVTAAVKYRMRDNLFAELINMAKINGPLSSDDLEKILEASKIVERMKGE